MKKVLTLLAICLITISCNNFKINKTNTMHTDQLLETGKSIYDFKAGDTIIRVKPAANGEMSFREYPGIFEGIKNNLIYIRYIGAGLDDTTARLPIEKYKDNWQIYEEPNASFNKTI